MQRENERLNFNDFEHLETDRANGIDQREEDLSCQVSQYSALLCLIEEKDDDESHSQMDEALIRSAVNLEETCQKVEKRINDLDLEVDRANWIDQQEEYLSSQVTDYESLLCLIEEEDDDERFSRFNDSQITFLSKRIEKLESENAKIWEDAEARIKELNELLLSSRDEVAAPQIAQMTAVTLQSTAEQKADENRKDLSNLIA